MISVQILECFQTWPKKTLSKFRHLIVTELSKKISLRKLLQKEVDPLKENISFTEVRSIINKGLAIDFATEEQAERLIPNLANKEELNTAVEARKFERRNPRCIIYDVPTTTSEENILRAIEADTGFEATNFSLSFRTRERGGQEPLCSPGTARGIQGPPEWQKNCHRMDEAFSKRAL
ncbi:hypothetical protein AVEN_200325-1 [Araneus ventricosus]|uniref:Uncharacterized protein n=1 Tax=Araneus ventricosus TaxID=182803 RepID=A0A4Y2GXS5_ARAVE|nr:hypothetical protein AVEN_200325-1 [Araneus ventricosus]